MVEWIKFIAPLIGIAGLWWKLTTSMVTKTELNAMRSDMADMKADLKEDIAEVKRICQPSRLIPKRKTRS